MGSGNKGLFCLGLWRAKGDRLQGSDEDWKIEDAEDNLQEHDGCRSAEGDAAARRFIDVGEDAADEGEQKRDRPKPGAARHAGHHEHHANQCAKQRSCVAEVARAARDEVEDEGRGSSDGDAGIRERGKEAARWIERESDEAGSGAEDVAECVGRKTVAGEKKQERAERGGEHDGESLAAVALGDPEHENEAEECGDGQRDDVRGGGDSEDDGEQDDARAPFTSRTLHGMGDADASVDAAIEAERGEDFGIGGDAGLEDGAARNSRARERCSRPDCRRDAA